MTNPNKGPDELRLLQIADRLRQRTAGDPKYPSGNKVGLQDGTSFTYELPTPGVPEKLTQLDIDGNIVLTAWFEPLRPSPSDQRPGRQILIGAMAVKGLFRAIQIEERGDAIVASEYRSNEPVFLQRVDDVARTYNPMQPQDLNHQRALYELSTQQDQIRDHLSGAILRLTTLV